MRRRFKIPLASLISTALLVAVVAKAQEAQVRDLTESDVTAEQLIEVLTPAGQSPASQPGVRGLGIAARPQCQVFRHGASRGLGLKPTANIAALRIHFAFNSAEILPEAKRNLDALGRALASPELSSYCFQIEGYTDSRGTEGYNNALSTRRAAAVVQYLNSELRLDPSRLLPVGHGEANPIADNDSEAGRAKNRRVQVVNVGDGSSSPPPTP